MAMIEEILLPFAKEIRSSDFENKGFDFTPRPWREALGPDQELEAALDRFGSRVSRGVGIARAIRWRTEVACVSCEQVRVVSEQEKARRTKGSLSHLPARRSWSSPESARNLPPRMRPIATTVRRSLWCWEVAAGRISPGRWWSSRPATRSSFRLAR